MITSMTNQRVKRIVQLSKGAGLRKKEDVFLAEGVKMFLEAPEKNLEEVYVSESFFTHMELQGEEGEGIKEKLEDCGYETVSEDVFAKMSDTRTPQGILFTVRQQHYALEEMIHGMPYAVHGGDGSPLFLMLENIQDPGNLGTMIRSGEGAGICGVIMSRDTVDIYNPKVIRATMGSVYRVPFCYVEDLEEAAGQMKDAGVDIFAAHLSGERNYDKCNYRRASAFLIGNEGNGLTEKAAALADVRVKIPMAGEVESLNAAVAAALLMFEAARQKRS